MTLDFFGCCPQATNSMEYCFKELKNAAIKARLTVLGEVCHQFSPQGLSIIFLLSESHLALHSSPDLGIVSIDLFTCGTKAIPDAIIDPLFRAFYAKEYHFQGQNRGVLK